MALEFIYCSSGIYVATFFVLGSVFIIAVLVTESFSWEEKPLYWIIGFTAALLMSWIFVGSVVWLYYECWRARFKQRIRRNNAQASDLADENIALQEEVELEELAHVEDCIQEETEPEDPIHEEVCTEDETNLDFEIWRSRIKRPIRRNKAQTTGSAVEEVGQREEIELKELAHEEVCKEGKTKPEGAIHEEVCKQKEAKVNFDVGRSRIIRPILMNKAQTSSSADAEVGQREEIELKELAHEEACKREKTTVESATGEVRKREEIKFDVPVHKSLSRRKPKPKYKVRFQLKEDS